MKTFNFLLLISLFAGLSASAQSLQRHVINVGDFTQLRVSKGINVDYRSNPDSAGLAIFYAAPEAVSNVAFSNNNKGRLTIQTNLANGDDRTALPTVTVYSRSLNNIENRGDSTVRAFDVITGDNFKAKLEGNGRLSLRNINARQVSAGIFTGRGQLAIDGKCDKASLSCTGVGAVQADGLIATDASATINGTGNIGCHVTGELTIKGTGPGTVYYKGTPAKITNHSIATKYQPMD